MSDFETFIRNYKCPGTHASHCAEGFTSETEETTNELDVEVLPDSNSSSEAQSGLLLGAIHNAMERAGVDDSINNELFHDEHRPEHGWTDPKEVVLPE